MLTVGRRSKTISSDERLLPELSIALGTLLVAGVLVGFHLWCFYAGRLWAVAQKLEVEPFKGGIPPEVFVLLAVVGFLAECTLSARKLVSTSGIRLSRALFLQSLAYLPCLALLPDAFYYANVKRGLPYVAIFVFPLVMGLVVALRRLWLPNGAEEEKGAQRDAKRYLAALLLLMGAYALYFSWLTIRRYHALKIGYSDAGLFWEIVRHSSGGKLFFTNHYLYEHQTFLALHVQPLLLLLVPFYWLHSGLETLFVVQALVLASGALALYLLARDELRSEKLALLLAAVYLFYPPLQNLHSNYYEGFHTVSLAVPFLLFAFLFLRRGNTWAYALFTGLALFCKENVGLVVFSLGIYAFFSLKRRRLGAVTVVAGLLWTVACAQLVIPYFRGEAYPFWKDLYPNLPDQLAHPWKLFGLIFSARKVVFLLELLTPLALLALLNPSTLLLAIFPLGISLLVENQDPTEGGRWAYFSTLFHNHSLIIPGLLISAVMGVKRIIGWQGGLGALLRKFKLPANTDAAALGRALAGLLLVTAFLCSFFLGSLPISIGFLPELAETSSKTKLIPQLKEMIPTEATLEATDFIANHFLDREGMRVLPPEVRPTADYVLLDLGDKWLELDLTGKSRRKLTGLISSLKDSGEYRMVFSREGIFLLRRIQPSASNKS